MFLWRYFCWKSTNKCFLLLLRCIKFSILTYTANLHQLPLPSRSWALWFLLRGCQKGKDPPRNFPAIDHGKVGTKQTEINPTDSEKTLHTMPREENSREKQNPEGKESETEPNVQEQYHHRKRWEILLLHNHPKWEEELQLIFDFTLAKENLHGVCVRLPLFFLGRQQRQARNQEEGSRHQYLWLFPQRP